MAKKIEGVVLLLTIFLFSPSRGKFKKRYGAEFSPSRPKLKKDRKSFPSFSPTPAKLKNILGYESPGI